MSKRKATDATVSSRNPHMPPLINTTVPTRASQSATPSLSPTPEQSPAPSQSPAPNSIILESPHSAASDTGFTFIQGRGDEFSESLKTVQVIAKIIESNYTGCWPKWKRIPEEKRLMMFREFGKKFTWHERETTTIWRIFEKISSNCLRGRMKKCRETKRRPIWIPECVWPELVNYWETDSFKVVSRKNKINRATYNPAVGFPLHCGGSVSHLTHRDRLAKAKGVESIEHDEWFEHLHTRVDKETGQRKYVNALAENQANEWKEEIATYHADHPETQDEPIGINVQNQLWIKRFGKKKGRVRGLAGLGPLIVESTGSSSMSAGFGNTVEIELREKIEVLTQDNANLKEVHEAMLSKFESLEQRLNMMSSAPQYQPFTQQTPYYPPSGPYMQPHDSYVQPPGFNNPHKKRPCMPPTKEVYYGKNRSDFSNGINDVGNDTTDSD